EREGESEDVESQEDEATTQSITRRTDRDGEVIEGWIRVAFATAERHAAGHLAICPPMDRRPACFAEQASGPAAEIKIAQVLCHGVRFELKLDEPAAERSSVVVEFAIREG